MAHLAVCIIASLVWSLFYRFSLQLLCDERGTLTGVALVSSLAVFIIATFTGGLLFNRTAALLGSCGGLCLYFAAYSYFILIRRGARLGITWTIVTLSMSIPTAGSIILWREQPSLYQWVGLLLTVASISLFGRRGGGDGRPPVKDMWLLALAFLLSGAGMLIIKTLVGLNLTAYRNVYFSFLYGSMFLLSGVSLAATGHRPTRRELLIGAVMGLGGIGNLWFLMLALKSVPGIVAFPMRTCGSILLTLAASRILWDERVTVREIAGVLLALASIVLMNL
jgi:drug/metabolite transporter (DMT)-like permease